MNSNIILLNNYKEKIFYIIDHGKLGYFLLLNKYNYYSNIVINDNYLDLMKKMIMVLNIYLLIY